MRQTLRRYCLTLSALPILFCGQAFAAPECAIKKVAAFDVVPLNGTLLIKAKIKGREVNLQVDTGAPFSLFNRRLSEELSLPRVSVQREALLNMAGDTVSEMVTVPEIQLDKLIGKNIPFYIAPAESGSKVDGKLGADFFIHYDIEIDLAHQKFNIFSQDHCKGQVVYWTKDYDAIPFKMNTAHHILFPLRLNYDGFTGAIDTGSPGSYIFMRQARQVAGVDPEANGDKPDVSVMGVPGYRYRFEALEIGEIGFKNTELTIVEDKNTHFFDKTRADMASHNRDIDLNTRRDVVVGLQHLSKLRIYVAYGERMIYVSAAGAE